MQRAHMMRPQQSSCRSYCAGFSVFSSYVGGMDDRGFAQVQQVSELMIVVQGNFVSLKTQNMEEEVVIEWRPCSQMQDGSVCRCCHRGSDGRIGKSAFEDWLKCAAKADINPTSESPPSRISNSPADVDCRTPYRHSTTTTQYVNIPHRGMFLFGSRVPFR